MRSFFAISLALVAGCGDNLSGPEGLPDEQAPENGNEAADPTARIKPEICGVRTWDEVVYEAKDTELRAVGTESGAAVFMVPRSGGMLRGFVVDGRGLISGDPKGLKIRNEGIYTSLSAGRVDGRFVVGLVAGDHTSVNVIREDLGDYRELAVVDGAFIGDATMMHSRNTKVTTTGGSSGMLMSTFDANWAPMGTRVVARSVPISMTSAAYGTDAMIGWSTPTECHVQRVASGIESMQPYPCSNNRIAVDYASRGGWMVYESGPSVMIGQIRADGHNQIANELPLVQHGSSPRIAFDGARFWVSYIDERGDVVVGFLDNHGAFDSRVMDGTRPMAGAYDLAVIGGSPWIYAIDGNGVGATKLCAVAQ
jgi:hypothetical protein